MARDAELSERKMNGICTSLNIEFMFSATLFRIIMGKHDDETKCENVIIPLKGFAH